MSHPDHTHEDTKQAALAVLRSLLRPRPADGHKGTFGHALLVAGCYGMAGAGILAGRACMRSGAGKLTVHIPQRNNDIMQTSLPEAVLHHDESERRWTSSPLLRDAFGIRSGYNAIGAGPGIGTHELTAEALRDLLEGVSDCISRGCRIPMVLDADALNILARHPDWTGLLPEDTILTPHPLEYRRLADAGADLSRTVLVLKGHPTVITVRGREVFRCPWGNSGMGTAGSGDVLTGIILGFLAQGYPQADAAMLGVSLHAISGDMAALRLGEHSLIASDLVEHLPEAFRYVDAATGDE